MGKRVNLEKIATDPDLDTRIPKDCALDDLDTLYSAQEKTETRQIRNYGRQGTQEVFEST